MGDKIEIIKKCSRHINTRAMREVFSYIQEHGIKGLKGYVVNRVMTAGRPYELWFDDHKVSEMELKRQREEKFSYEPKISIIVPVYRTPINYLEDMINSVISQTYQNWELCIADGSEGNQQIIDRMNQYCLADHRIQYTILKKNEGMMICWLQMLCTKWLENFKKKRGMYCIQMRIC